MNVKRTALLSALLMICLMQIGYAQTAEKPTTTPPCVITNISMTPLNHQKVLVEYHVVAKTNCTAQITYDQQSLHSEELSVGEHHISAVVTLPVNERNSDYETNREGAPDKPEGQRIVITVDGT